MIALRKNDNVISDPRITDATTAEKITLNESINDSTTESMYFRIYDPDNPFTTSLQYKQSDDSR